MKLFKAISYDGKSPKMMSSQFKGEFANHSCWLDLIHTALTHVSHGEKGKNKDKRQDYWISTTDNYEVALKYLKENSKYNGIAVIDLPNTHLTGLIYDKTLRMKGYIEKDHTSEKRKALWEPNEDGVVTSLNLSSQSTINYLNSYLWLKGVIEPIGNIRAALYANTDHELLIMGENIKFEFYPRNELRNFQSERTLDYYDKLYLILLANSPDSNEKEKDLLKMTELHRHFMSEIKKLELDKLLMEFYENARYTFNKKIAENKFKSLHSTEQLNGYEIADYRYNIPWYDFINAYVYSSAYWRINMETKLPQKSIVANSIYELYNSRQLTKELMEDMIIQYRVSYEYYPRIPFRFYPVDYEKSYEAKIEKMKAEPKCVFHE